MYQNYLCEQAHYIAICRSANFLQYCHKTEQQSNFPASRKPVQQTDLADAAMSFSVSMAAESEMPPFARSEGKEPYEKNHSVV